MKRFALPLSALLIVALAACGGGSSSSAPPKANNPVSFTTSSGSITDAMHRSATLRREASGSCGAATSPIVTQALGSNFAPTAGESWQAYWAIATATELNSACQSETTTPTWTTAGDGIVSLTTQSINGSAVASPGPNSVNIVGTTAGQTTLTATFPDGTTGTVPVDSYATLIISCGQQGQWYGATSGWSATAGNVSSGVQGMCGTTYTSPSATADVYSEGTDGNVDFPDGYQIVENTVNGAAPSPNDIASITSCSSFTSQGTTYQPDQNRTYPEILIVWKNSNNTCVKMLATDVGIGTIGGLYEVSDSSGHFAY